MKLSSSTLTGHPGEATAGPHRAAARILGGSQVTHAEAAALLLPMVRRAVRTERGPSALVSWLRRYSGSVLGGDPAQGAALAEGLARLLFDPFGSPADTIEDSRGHPTARPVPDAT